MTSRRSRDNNPAHTSPHPFSSRSPLNEQQIVNLAGGQPTAVDVRQILHLVPCTWEEFLQLDQHPCGYYDYVDGIVLRCPNMPNAEHQSLGRSHATVLECSSRLVSVVLTPSIQVLNERQRLEWTINPESNQTNCNRASSSPHLSQSGMRHPDFAIIKTRRNSDGSSSTSRDPQVKKSIEFPHPYTDRFLAAAEITSQSTRKVDLGVKWAAYARSGVHLYIILDRGTEANPNRIIVGSREHFDGAEQSISGDTQTPPPRGSRTRPQIPFFYRKVYREPDIVDCPYYSELHLTVAQLLDEKTMRNLATRMYNERRGRAQQAELAQQERDKERRKRAMAEREREKAEREQEKERRKRRELEEELKKMKQERDEERRQRKAGNDRDRGTRKGQSRNAEGEDKKAQAVKKGSPSASGSPQHKKSRR